MSTRFIVPFIEREFDDGWPFRYGFAKVIGTKNGFDNYLFPSNHYFSNIDKYATKGWYFIISGKFRNEYTESSNNYPGFIQRVDGSVDTTYITGGLTNKSIMDYDGYHTISPFDANMDDQPLAQYLRFQSTGVVESFSFLSEDTHMFRRWQAPSDCDIINAQYIRYNAIVTIRAYDRNDAYRTDWFKLFFNNRQGIPIQEVFRTVPSDVFMIHDKYSEGMYYTTWHISTLGDRFANGVCLSTWVLPTIRNNLIGGIRIGVKADASNKKLLFCVNEACAEYKFEYH